ncbi:MAG: hypothetical protein K9L30_16715 [Desulfobacterales bacterium]|nr:hypothetical protein [Desulfobacterales bacterium]
MTEFIFIKNSQVNYYKDIPLYDKTDEGEFVLYKPESTTLDNKRIKESRHPQLYLHQNDKKTAIKELQHPFKTLQLIKGEVIEEGKFNREIFITRCNSLV